MDRVAPWFLPQCLQVDSQLLGLLVKMAALQAECLGGVGNVIVVALELHDDHIPLETLDTLSQWP